MSEWCALVATATCRICDNANRFAKTPTKFKRKHEPQSVSLHGLHLEHPLDTAATSKCPCLRKGWSENWQAQPQRLADSPSSSAASMVLITSGCVVGVHASTRSSVDTTRGT